MHAMLKDFEVAKRDKEKREKELEEEIMNMNRVDDDDEEEDIELEMARGESIRQFDKNEFRRRAGGRYKGGGSSRQPQGLGRSTTIRERGKEATRHTSTPAERLATAEIELEKSRAQSKQPKLNTKWLKIQKEKLHKAFENFISPWTRSLLRTAAEVRPNISSPSVYEISELFLKNEYNEMKKFIASFEGIWKERRVTIMCDGWSGPTRMSIINFLVYSNNDTVFHKSIDASNVEHKDAEYYFKIMKEVVEEIDPEKVIQVVTDNEATIKAAHCIDLILEDFGKRKSINKVIKQAKFITQFIYNHNWVVNYMKNLQTIEILFAPTLHDLMRLRNMFESGQWIARRFGQATSGPPYEARNIVLGLGNEERNFWEKAQEIIKIQEPLLKVLKLLDGDEKPTTGFVFEAIERSKLAIKANARSYIEYWKIIDHHWNIQLHHDLHATSKLMP
ncbi:hypothetical protein P3X46_021600 [Hevea brasiliensis]|uniref:DUF659 domain-containing protein n=1 Tax=Hevea brasiliensis TaxID=3981 RepID=A0ABQ9LJW8_HEVBR|nr:hypothetical protein P3X46_021600 [Hevea brasiliensis]